ncbi:MAG: ATP-binding cassette domain-containing protein [Actinomycetota bacterium]|nr:ATP-binding cassette domain-containing protein [Actinomycetota bacterium]
MNNAIEVKQLVKKFGSIAAVNNISFNVAQGEFFGFLGPNGAGKTTTIRMLTGIIKPSSGSISVMDYNISTQTLKAKQSMGIIPEVSNAYIDLTAWHNMMFQGELYGLNRKQRIDRSEKLLQEFELYERKNQLVKYYSKGMKQRLIICMALLNQPEVLFLDEPTSGLDVNSTRIIRAKIKEFNAGGTTIFLTTHNMEEANQLCDRIAIIEKGVLAAVNTPENLKLTTKELQSVVVAFEGKIDLDDLSSMHKVNRAEKVGDKFRLYTKNPGDLLFDLTDMARDRNLRIISLNTTTPTLEDVFLQLTKT